MKKILSIVLCLALVASLAVFNVSAKRLYGEDFVALQVKEGNCELVDNSATNNQAGNMPIGFYTSSHGTGCGSQGDSVKFPNVKIDKTATKVAIKGGYNNSAKPGTATEFWVYLNKIAGEPIAKISISDEETSSSRIANQIFKYADVNVAPGTYDVYIVSETENSGSFSEVAFIYEGKELDTKWKDDKNCVEISETGEEVVEEYVKYSYNEKNVIYISDEGNDMNDGLTAETPVQTFLMASFKLAEGEVGTYMIVGNVSAKGTLPAGNYFGYDSNSRIELDQNTRLGGACTFKNLRLRANKDWTTIVAQGHKLVIDENVRTEKADGVVQYPGVRVGAHKAPVHDGGEMILKSGQYHYIEATTSNAVFNGNAHVTIYDKVKARLFIVGSASEEFPQNGTSTFKFVGKSINVENPDTTSPIGLMDNLFIDLTEYEGDKDAVKGKYFANVDCIVLTNPELIPEDAMPRSAFEEPAEDTGDEEDTTGDEMTDDEKQQAEEAAKKAEEEKKAAEEAAKKAAEEEAAKKAAEEEAKKAAEEAAKAEEEAKKALEEAQTEEEKAAAEEALKKAEEEKAAAEEAAKKAEEEAKAAEEAAKKAEEEKKAAEEAAKSEEEKNANDEKVDDEKADDDEKTDASANEKGGISPIIWVVIAVVVVAVIAVVIVASKKKKNA